MIAVRGIALGAGVIYGFKSVNGVGCVGYLNARAAVDKSPAVSVVIIIVNAGKRSLLGREVECNAFTSPSAEGTLERNADNRYLTVYLNRKRGNVAFKSRIALGLKFVFMLSCFGCGKGIARKLLPFAAVNTVIIFVNSRISLGGKSYIYICCLSPPYTAETVTSVGAVPSITTPSERSIAETLPALSVALASTKPLKSGSLAGLFSLS